MAVASITTCVKKPDKGPIWGLGDFSKETFEWNTQDKLDGLIDPDNRSHPELASDLPGVILGVYIPVLLDSVETETLYHNDIYTSASANSDITHTPGVCDNSHDPTPFFATINATPETHINQ